MRLFDALRRKRYGIWDTDEATWVTLQGRILSSTDPFDPALRAYLGLQGSEIREFPGFVHPSDTRQLESQMSYLWRKKS